MAGVKINISQYVLYIVIVVIENHNSITKPTQILKCPAKFDPIQPNLT